MTSFILLEKQIPTLTFTGAENEPEDEQLVQEDARRFFATPEATPEKDKEEEEAKEEAEAVEEEGGEEDEEMEEELSRQMEATQSPHEGEEE